MQEHPTQQGRSSNPRLAHPHRIALIHLGLKQLSNEREQHLCENSGPLPVEMGDELFVGEECALEGGESLLADRAAGVEALVG
jgi:hypothetical protein